MVLKTLVAILTKLVTRQLRLGPVPDGAPAALPWRTTYRRQGAGAWQERRRTPWGSGRVSPDAGTCVKRRDSKHCCRQRHRKRPIRQTCGTTRARLPCNHHATEKPLGRRLTSQSSSRRGEAGEGPLRHAVGSTNAPRGCRKESRRALLLPPTEREKEGSVSLPCCRRHRAKGISREIAAEPRHRDKLREAHA